MLDDVVFKADARLPFYFRRVRGRYPFERQLRMRLVQHEFELTRLARGEQYQVAALVARAAGASAAVDEGFEVLRQSVLYDVADGVYVETAGRDMVATSMETRPPRSAESALLRSRWLMSPCIAVARKPMSQRRSAMSCVSARVPQKSRDLLGFSHIRTLTSPSKRLRDGMM